MAAPTRGPVRIRSFHPYFLLAIVLNFVPVLLAEPVRLEVSVVGAVHLVFAGRVVAARLASGRQRGRDLERFQRLRGTAQADLRLRVR